MVHHATKTPVTVEELDGQLCVRLHSWGGKDWLEDRLTEDFEVGRIWSRVSDKEEGDEVFFLILPDAKDRAAVQAILDQIK